MALLSSLRSKRASARIALHIVSRWMSSPASPVAVRLGLAQLVLVQPAPLDVATAGIRRSEPLIVSRANIDECLAEAAQKAAAGSPVDILVPVDVAESLLSGNVAQNLGTIAGDGALSQPVLGERAANPSAGAALPSPSQAAAVVTVPVDNATPAFAVANMQTIALHDVMKSLTASNSNSGRILVGGAPQIDMSTLTAPTDLPGRGSSSELVSTHHKRTTAPAAESSPEPVGQQQQEHHGRHRSDRWVSGSVNQHALARLSPVQQLFEACRRGKVAAIFQLLGSETGLHPTSQLNVDDICAHHWDNGATPLHLLVGGPAAHATDHDHQQHQRRRTALALSHEHVHRESTTSAAFGNAEHRDSHDHGSHVAHVNEHHASSVSTSAHGRVPLVIQAVRALVHAGADVDAPSANGSTPLHWAAGTGSLQLVKELLRLGANPIARTYTWRRQVFGRGSGQLPLHWAAESNHVDVVRYLSDFSAQSTFCADERGSTPIDLARKELAFDAAKVLDAAAKQQYVCLSLSVEARAHTVLGARGRVAVAADAHVEHRQSAAASPTDPLQLR